MSWVNEGSRAKVRSVCVHVICAPSGNIEVTVVSAAMGET